MSQRNEGIDLLLEELERHGLRGEVGDRGKHLEIAWNAPAGRRFVIVARTPSDWRASMNSRSDMRKMLRKDGLTPKPINELSFQKAMSLPKPVTLTKELLLQKDVDELTDLVFDLQGQIDSMKQYIGEALREQLAAMTVTSKVSFGDTEFEAARKHDVEMMQQIERKLHQQTVARSNVVQDGPFKAGSKQARIYGVLTDNFMHTSNIAELSGQSDKYVHTTLWKAKNLGFVESGLRGMYRRKK